MSGAKTVVEALSKLNIDSVPNEWVRENVENDFTDCDGFITEDFENQLRDNNYYVKGLQSVKTALKPWIVERQGDNEQGLWTVLVEHDISHKAILCLLSYLMELTQKRASDSTQLQAGLEAAAVYLSLIMVPGSGAFKIFHPVLFEKTTNCFKLWKRLTSGRRDSVESSGSQSSQKGKKRSRRSRTEEDEEMEVEEDGLLTTQAMSKVNTKLFALLKALTQLLERYSLKHVEESVYNTVQVLADLSKQEPETFMGQFTDNPDIEKMRTVPELCFHGLNLLCTNMHGDISTMIRNVLKSLLPSLLMLIGDNKATAAQSIPRDVKLTKDHALHFVCHMMKKEKEGIQSAVRILIQQLCTRVTDRAEYRTNVAEVVIELMKNLTGVQYAKMIEWVYRFGRNNKTGYRAFALDIACMLLNEKEREDVTEVEHAVFATHTFLLHMLLSRCSDVGPTVRARAITGFAHCVASTQPHVVSAVQSMVTPNVTANRPALTRVIPTPDAQRVGTDRPDNTTDCHMAESTNAGSDTVPEASDFVHSRNSRNSLETALATMHSRPRDSPLMTVQLTPGVEITLTDGKGVVSMLRRRVRDDKVNVRKAALHAMENLIRFNKDNVNAQDVEMISESCRDPSLLARKQAMSSITELLIDIPLDKNIQRMFLNGVLPMILDRESTAQEKCCNTCAQVILSNIVPAERSTEDCHKMAWGLLDIIAGNSGGDLRRYLNKCCAQWHKAGYFNKQLINSLKTHVGTENNRGAWMLLSEVTNFFPKFSAEFVIDYWTGVAQTTAENEYPVIQEVLTVLGHISKQVPQDRISDITAGLKVRLMDFNLPPELISVSVTTLSKLCEALTGDAGAADRMTKQWFVDLLHASDKYLSAAILNENPEESINEDKIICHLFTLGEIAQLCPDKTPKRIFMLVQSLISTPVITSLDGSSQIPSSQNNSSNQPSSQSNSQTDNQTSDALSTSKAEGDSQQSSQHSTQSMSGLSQGSQFTQSDVLSQFRGSKMPPRIRAYAFIALGKLCLQNEDIAKKCVAAMARELDICEDPVIRNNVVIIMCDLCIRYTQLVDSYIGSVSRCLKDDSVLIRKQTLTLLTHLLQEDYIKWKDSLFFRFVTSLVDDNEEIQKFGEFCLVHLLQQRHPGMFFQHFVECVFHFNSYETHKVYNKFPQTEKERKMFSLKGQACFKKRDKIYRFLLNHMTDEQKFKLTGKLCHDVLGGVVDDVIPYDADSAAIVQDTFSILCSKEIKLASLKTKSHEDVETEMEMAQAVIDVARKKVISQVLKMNVIENIVPTVISLKHLLEKKHSEVLRHLMLYLRELMKDYKNEVQDILAADKQLASEIEFDMRRFEEQEQAKNQAELARQQNLTPIAGNHAPRPGTPRTGNGTPVQTPARVIGTPQQRQPQTPATPNRTAPPVPRTPRTPAATPGPAVPCTPRTPANAQGTSARNCPLSTLAIINSAKKTMEQIKSAKKAGVPFTPQRNGANKSLQAPRTAAKRVAFSESVDARDQANDGSPTEFVDSDTPPVQTPKQNQKSGEANQARAISTPTANLTLSNITFMDPNASMIPPSPIPTALPITQVGSPQWRKQREVDPVTKLTRERDVLLMMSPDRPAPKPRVWNIRSPAERLELGDGDRQHNERNGDQNPSPGAQEPRPATKKSDKTSQQKDTSENIPLDKDLEQNTSVGKKRGKTKAKPLEEINTSVGTRRSSRNSAKNTSIATSDVSMDASVASENTSALGSGRRRSQRSKKN